MITRRVLGTLAILLVSAGVQANGQERRDAAADAPASGLPPHVEIIAHRGASYDAPENTLAAVKRAWEVGSDAVEFDVRLTQDGQLVAMHDADTARTAGVRKVVKQTPLAELRKLDVGRWKAEAFAGEVPPTLDEVLATVPRGPDAADKRLFIEVKVGPEAVPALLAGLDRAKLPAERTPVISFNYDTCRQVKQKRPALPVYWLVDFRKSQETGQWQPTARELIARACAVDLDGLDLSAKEPVDEQLIDQAKEAGLGLYVWTVDNPDVALRLARAGVDGITTNRPNVLLAMRQQSGAAQGSSATSPPAQVAAAQQPQ